MAKPNVLITGASGLIGRLTIAGLGDKYAFSALNRRPVAGIPCLQADINDAAIQPERSAAQAGSSSTCCTGSLIVILPS